MDIKTYDSGSQRSDLKLRLSRNEGICCFGDQKIPSVDAESINRYPDYSRLREAYASFMNVPSECVIPTAGGDEGIDRLIRLSNRTNRKSIVCHAPSFEMIDVYASQSGINCNGIQWFDGEFPIGEFGNNIDQQTSLVCLVSPNNPTGRKIPCGVVKEVVRLAKQSGALVLLDFAYIEFADFDPSAEVLEFDNVVILRTLSKAWGLAGLRAGFLVTSNMALAKQLNQFGSPFSISHVSAELATYAIENYATTMKTNVATTVEIRSQLQSVLADVNIPCLPSQGNFVLARFPETSNFKMGLDTMGISIRYFDSPVLSEWVRITCPTSFADLEFLATALKTQFANENATRQ
ncbi:MAG: histidinol-phosphate transaminase [Pirellulaceae bacterium]